MTANISILFKIRQSKLFFRLKALSPFITTTKWECDRVEILKTIIYKHLADVLFFLIGFFGLDH